MKPNIQIDDNMHNDNRHIDINHMLDIIDQDRVSTQSVHGSNDNKEFSKYRDVRLSRLFESIQYGPPNVDDRHTNRSDPNKNNNNQNSEIFALKREIERKVSKPIHLNIMIIGRKSTGKTSFIRMLLNYV